MKKTDKINTEILQINSDYNDTREFTQDMLKWLDRLSEDDDVDDIGTMILQKITLSITGNYNLLITSLGELTDWENYYNQRVSYYKKARDRDRYLKGDFDKEKEELIRIK